MRFLNIVKSKYCKKLVAFTLAETLIVIGIIGVVAALTIPNLSQNTGEKEKVAKVKKLYSNIEDAVGRVQATYGPINQWSDADSDKFPDRISDFLKFSKSCSSSSSACFTKQENGESLGIKDCLSNGNASFILADGSSLMIASRCAFSKWAFLIDIDGPTKGKSAWGEDLFAFSFAENPNELTANCIGFKSVSNNQYTCDYQDNTNEQLTANCFTNNKHFLCGNWILQTGNMDYLKASNGVCPGSHSLSWANTTCK